MANSFAYASVFQTELDKAAVANASSGWMEINENLIKYSGGKEVKIPKLDMSGLGDYSGGAPEGDITLTYETKSMTKDRGRMFTFDEHEVNDTNFAVTASRVMGEFQRKKVVPEIDAYRYSTIATGAITNSRASGGYTPAEATILKKLYDDIAAVQDVVGDIPLVITMSPITLAILSNNTQISKKLDVTGFRQGNVDLKVQAIDGVHPIIAAPSARLKTAYTYYDGRTASDGAETNPTPDQRPGGFVAAATAKDINWIICPRDVPIAVSRTDKVRVFDPETYQSKRSWACDYRKYHDLWILDNRWAEVFVNIKQALT